jgi:hypothetical protein
LWGDEASEVAPSDRQALSTSFNGAQEATRLEPAQACDGTALRDDL